MRTSFVFLFLLLSNRLSCAQDYIDLMHNALRNGDVLNKEEAIFVTPGGRGTSQVWELGHYDKDGETIQQRIVSSGDTVAIFETSLTHVLFMQDDALCYKSRQRPRTFMLFDTLLPVLRYPFHFGDSIYGHCSGAGRDESTCISRSGWGYTVADGKGILTDGRDTLYNALRVHHHEDFTDTFFSADTVKVRIVEDSYQWYVAGCRYPVQESRIRLVEEGDSLVPLDSKTFLFLPDAQYGLPYDPANDSIASVQNHAHHSSLQVTPLTDFEASIPADGSHLIIRFSLSQSCDLTLTVCDVMGNILCYKRWANCASGDWQDCLELSRRPVGNTVMVNVQCNGQETTYKVTK